MLQSLTAELNIEQASLSINFALIKDNRVLQRKLKPGDSLNFAWKNEMEAALVVERCHQIIDSQITAFTREKIESVKLHIPQILAGKVQVETFICQEILNKKTIDELLQTIRYPLQLEINKCFGKTSDDLAAYHIDRQEYVNIDQLVTGVNEYRKTLFLAAGATELGNRIWRQTLKHLRLNFLYEELMQEIKLGSIYMQTVGCDYKMLAKKYCRQLEQELAGIIFSISHKIKLSLRKKFTQLFYNMYDHAHSGDSAITERNKEIRGFRGKKRPRCFRGLVLFNRQAM